MVAGVNNEGPFGPVSRLRGSKIGGKHCGPTHRSRSTAIGRELSVKIVDGEDLDDNVLPGAGLSDGRDGFRWNICTGLHPHEQARSKEGYVRPPGQCLAKDSVVRHHKHVRRRVVGR